MPDADEKRRAAQLEREAEMAERQKADDQAYQDLGTRTLAIDDDQAIAEALRLLALGELRSLPAGDVLLPYPDGYEPGQGPPDEDVAMAIAEASPADLAHALIRDFLDLYIERHSWQANQYPWMKKAARRVGRLLGPAPPGGG